MLGVDESGECFFVMTEDTDAVYYPDGSSIMMALVGPYLNEDAD